MDVSLYLSLGQVLDIQRNKSGSRPSKKKGMKPIICDSTMHEELWDPAMSEEIILQTLINFAPQSTVWGDLKEGWQGTHHWQGRELAENIVCPRDSQLAQVCCACNLRCLQDWDNILNAKSEHLISGTTSKRTNCHCRSTTEVATVQC